MIIKNFRYLLIAVVSLFISFQLNAQAGKDSLSLKGKIVSGKDQSPIPGATIRLINIKDSTRSKYLSANVDGSFLIENLERAFYRLKVSSIGFKSFEKLFRLQMPDSDLGTISMAIDIVQLDAVNIDEQIAPVQQKGDTTQYNADAFKTNPDATSKDLVKKMPGIIVNNDGVTANGETVEQVLLDGKRFFGQDPLLSLNSIPAEIVDKVLVYDEQSEQSKLTGFDDGNTIKTMNLITKDGKKNGQFGNVYGGLGDQDLYKAGGSINSFNKEQRITLLGMSNNINQQNFGQEDLAGVSGSGGRGGFRRGGSSFMTGVQDGITNTNSVGLNFTDQLSKKLSIEASYFFNGTNNTQKENRSRETFLANGSQFYQEDKTDNTDNLNHRINVRLDYKIDDYNSLLFRTNLSSQEQESKELTIGRTFTESNLPINLTNNLYQSNNDIININNTIIYQHKFKKIGRTLSFDTRQQIRPSEQEISFQDFEQDSLIEYNTDGIYSQYSAELTYTEPIGSLGQLSGSYEYKAAIRDSKTDVFGVNDGDERSFISGLSNDFESIYTYHQPSVRYSYRQMSKFFDFSLAYQEAKLDNASLLINERSVENRFSAFLPTVMARFEFSSKSRVFMRYSTNTTEPTISQLQNVVNNTNPFFISNGNPDLNQSYSHSMRISYRHTNSEKNLSFSNYSRIQNTSNYITDNTTVLRSDSILQGVLLPRGAQLTTPTNLNGYWSIRNNSTFGIAIPKIKNNLNLSVNLQYVRTPGLNNSRLNISDNYSVGLQLGLTSNISEKIDYNIYYEINGSRVLNSLQSGANNQYYTQTIATELDLTIIEGLIWRNETYFQRYIGSDASFNTTYTLWNMGIAKKFLKNNSGEIELSVFDLLGENQSFSQNVNSRFLEEVQTQVLQRYFMLTFTYQIRNFN